MVIIYLTLASFNRRGGGSGGNVVRLFGGLSCRGLDCLWSRSDRVGGSDSMMFFIMRPLVFDPISLKNNQGKTTVKQGKKCSE